MPAQPPCAPTRADARPASTTARPVAAQGALAGLHEAAATREARPQATAQLPAKKSKSIGKTQGNRARAKNEGQAKRGDIVRVSYRKAPSPPFPTSMRAIRAEGRVGVRIAVNTTGKPTQVNITNSSGHKGLAHIAHTWIMRTWLCNPALEYAIDTPSRVTTSINFVRS